LLQLQAKRNVELDEPYNVFVHGMGWMEYTRTALPGGKVVTFVSSVDEAMRARMETERALGGLERAARTDQLTGLRNQRGFLEQEAEIATKPDGQTVTVLIIDFDRFRAFNEANGIDAGDRALKYFARTIEATCHSGMIAARLMADQFALFADCFEDRNAVEEFVAGLTKVFSEPVKIGLFRNRFLPRIGYAMGNTGPHFSLEEMLARAERAIRAAKTGTKRVVSYSKLMAAKEQEEEAFASEITTAIARDAFVPFFQPQVESASGKLVGLEVLARWKRDRQTIDGPGEFHDAAIRYGLIDLIDDQIFDKGLTALKEWRQTGLVVPHVSFNLTASRLRSHDLINDIIWRVDAADLTPDDVAFEILETVLFEADDDAAVMNIRLLAQKGFRIELDDFGTAHASLSSLRNFPVNKIKLDRSFVSKIDKEPQLARLSGAIIQLGRTLDLTVLAEGVETEPERMMLHSLGCQEIQGCAASSFQVRFPRPPPEL
jgi:diguanylate cyclase (GGDEF)-like protein